MLYFKVKSFLEYKQLLLTALCLTCIVSFLLLSTRLVAASVIFQDNFDDGVADGWTVQRNPCRYLSDPAEWKVVNGKFGIKILDYGGGCVTEITPDNWPGSLVNYQIDLDMEFVSGTDKNLAFRYVSPTQWYDLKFDSNSNIIAYQQIPNDGDYFPQPYPLPNGKTYHITVEVLLGSVKTWVDGNLALSKTFNPVGEFSPSGKLALQASVGGDPGSEVYFDNIVVTSLDPDPTPTATPTPSPTPTPTPTPTPSPTPLPPTPTPSPTPAPFPYFSQKDPEWSDDIYNNAITWNPLDPSFGRWGCAVTSSAMVLKYHGITTLPNGLGTSPGNLNAWLKTRPRGYVDGGKLNWEAIAEATKLMQMTNPLWPKLEIKKITGTLATLSSELLAGRPAIVQVNSGHFVTAYHSNTPTDIDIADPFFPRTKLSDYGNTFLSMRTLRPSQTDFGNLSLYMRPEHTMILERKQGSDYVAVDETETIIEELWGQPGDQPAGPASKILDYHQPSDGEYRIKITKSSPGISPYTLLIRDEAGNSSDSEGTILFGTEPVYLYFTYAKNAGQDGVRVVKHLSFDTLEQEIRTTKKLGLFKKKYDGGDLLILLQVSEHLYGKNRHASRVAYGLFLSLLNKRESLISPEAYGLLRTDALALRAILF